MIHKCKMSIIRKKETVLGRKFPFSSEVFFIFACFSVFFFNGCQSTRDNYPVIVHPSSPGQQLPPEISSDWKPPEVESSSDVPWGWIPPKSVEKNWTAIIVHHSATETGNMAKFHKSHIEEHGWDGVGYDFVIGNGTDSGDGEIEVTYRWRDQKTGAHCWTPDNWANTDGIGICLVGNFNNRKPTKRQMDSLVKLTDFLQKRYRIPQSRITGHGETRDAHATDCPGRLFPMSSFKSMLNF
ncbi:MAG: N-acetylmuramoyl-L-alanine amidase [Sedimentisphaerales bacterium]|nr:N-acetylmuramoyl-L-alanine amidase [Sedimentisphaerales bacterium]